MSVENALMNLVSDKDYTGPNIFGNILGSTMKAGMDWLIAPGLWDSVNEALSLGETFNSVYSSLTGGSSLWNDITSIFSSNKKLDDKSPEVTDIKSKIQAAINAIQSGTPTIEMPMTCRGGNPESCDENRIKGWMEEGKKLQQDIDKNICQLSNLKKQKTDIENALSSCTLKLETISVQENPPPPTTETTTQESSCGCNLSPIVNKTPNTTCSKTPNSTSCGCSKKSNSSKSKSKPKSKSVKVKVKSSCGCSKSSKHPTKRSVKKSTCGKSNGNYEFMGWMDDNSTISSYPKYNDYYLMEDI